MADVDIAPITHVHPDPVPVNPAVKKTIHTPAVSVTVDVFTSVHVPVVNAVPVIEGEELYPRQLEEGVPE